MNRVIKFRAWDKEEKKMYFDVQNNYDNIREQTCFQDNNLEFMQFTGLHDKNGKEIYEGDIVKMGTDKDMKFYISVIVYEAPEFLCKNGKNLNTLFRNWEYGYEVIGNIHENPELLK
jgi:uncharacterized phage protein (TIGR01671 family)